MILVTGATGNVGGELVAHLCRQGADVRALVRSPEKADTLRGYDCAVAVGTFEDVDSLVTAMAACEAVFLVAPAGPDQPAQERNVIDAAVRAGVARIVKVAALGHGDGSVRMLRNHAEVLDHLKASGLAHTVLSPTSFMQNLLRSAASVQENQAIRAPEGSTPVSFVDARDVAAVGAHVLTSTGHDGADYPVTGPEALTYADIAAHLSTVLGREIRHDDVPLEQTRDALVARGMPEWQAEGMVELTAYYQQGHGAEVTDEVTKATGRPARRVADFLKDHRSAFA